MNILDLAEEIGLQPKRSASTNGDEYKSPCPQCKSGKNRFCIWPKKGTGGSYWCRVCKCKGDAIQFCRDFFGLGYVDACKKINIPVKERTSPKGYNPFLNKSVFTPRLIQPVSSSWQSAALAFVQRSNKVLLSTPSVLEYLLSRGLTRETIIAFNLGWNPSTIFDNRRTWGLPLMYNDKGNEKKQWLPQGIVIPAMENGVISRIKIRRSDWHVEDPLPKYVEVSGSTSRLSLYGDPSKPVIVMESELDAILVQQFAADLCCCIALGGVGKRPDVQLHQFLKEAPLILLSLDHDEAGKKEYPFWMSVYPNLRPWPARKGKSPGDSFAYHNVDLLKWICDGLKFIA